MSPGADLSADLALALAAATEAGEAVMESFRSPGEVRMKGPGQPVTDADLRADRLLGERLRGERPEYGWLSEESEADPDRSRKPRVWVVDPIDGTRSFIAGYREFAVSVGLVEDGRVVIGVVYNPAQRDLFWAVADAGAWRARPWTGAWQGEPLRVRDPDPGRTPTLLVSRSELRRGEFEPFAGEWRLRQVGSTAYKLMGVAAGFGDAFLSRGPKSEWDVAGGALVVEEAGGVVTDIRGRRLGFNQPRPEHEGIVASTPGLHRRLVTALAGLETVRQN